MLNIKADRIWKMLFSGALLKGAGLALNVLFIQALSWRLTEEAFGFVGTVMSAAAIIGPIIGRGMPDALMRVAARSDREVESFLPPILKRLLLVAVFIAVLVGALLTVPGLARYYDSDPAIPVALALLSLALAASELFSSAFRIKNRIFSALAPREIVWRALAIAFVYLAPSSAFGPVFLPTIALLYIVLGFQFWRLRPHEPNGEYASLDELDAIAPKMWTEQIVFQLGQQAVVIIAAIVLGPVSAGIFFVLDRLGKLTSFSLVTLAATTAPEISRYYGARELDKLQVFVRNTTWLALLGWVVSAVALIALQPLLFVLFKQLDASITPLLLVVVLGQGVSVLCGNNRIVMNMTAHETELAKLSALWSGLLVVSGFVGAWCWGLIGLVIADACARACSNLHISYTCYRLTGIQTIPLFHVFRRQSM